MNNEETHILTDAQTLATSKIAAQVDKIRSERGITNQSVQACEAYAKENLAGTSKAEEKNENHELRIEFASGLLQVPREGIVANRVTAQAVGKLMVAMLFNTSLEEMRTNYADLLKTEKTPEPSESETALAETFANKLTVSKNLSKLTPDEIKNVQAATHASLQTVCKYLSPVDEKGKIISETAFPMSCYNFISYLMAASGGKSEFALTDKFIAETSNITTKTVQRNRNDLKDWMQKTGKGIVDVIETAGQPTKYKLTLLDLTTAVMERILSGTGVSTERLVNLAGLSGKLLSGQKLQGVAEADLQNATALSDQLLEIVGTLPEPTIQVGADSDARALQAGEAKAKKILAEVEELKTLASAAEFTEAEEEADAVLAEVNTAIKAGTPINPKEVSERLATLRQKVSNQTATDLDKAISKRDAEIAAGNQPRTETLAQYAEAYVATVSGEDADAVIAQRIASIRESVFVIQAIAIIHGSQPSLPTKIRNILTEAGFAFVSEVDDPAAADMQEHIDAGDDFDTDDQADEATA